jgi:DNA-binding response OmpR family regulator
MLRHDAERREVRVGECDVDVTCAEFELLSTLAAGPGRVWSRSELVSRLPGEHEASEPRSTRT